jgi:hypothetical protein
VSRDLYEQEPERDAQSAAVPARACDAQVVIMPLPESERTEDRANGRLREPVARHRLSRDAVETLQEIGRFRVVSADDLQRFRYQGDGSAMRQDLRSLRSQGLLSQRTLLHRGSRLAVVTLTKDGQKLLRRDDQLSSGQAIYAGLVKPREVPHDAAIYRMYQAEAASIRARGGTVRRVVLDYELKRKVYAPLAKVRPQLKPEEYAKRQAEVATANGLEVVNGKIPLPDLRIEYQTRDGEMAKVDLELATDHYKASQLAEKASAGFVVYGEAGGSKPEDRDLISEILSL